MSDPETGIFRSLRNFNYRMWAGGALVSNIGTWLQRTAQDWLVLTQLTHRNATAMGVVMALQFGPAIFLLPWTGFAADHFDRRKILIATQAAMGLLALGLGLLTITGAVQLWHVYGFAFLLGCVTAFDSTARQTFVSELVPEIDLSNAVALNSTSFNAARLIGPAVAGLLIAAVGTGWVFLINAASFVAVLFSLNLMRVEELHREPRAVRVRGGLVEGFRYVWERPDITVVLFMLALIGTFGINFAIFISTMSVNVFHVGAGRFGVLTSMMAVGSVSGALLSARRSKSGVALLLFSALIFGGGFAVAAAMPNYWLFGLVLIVIGAASQTFTTTANSTVQLSTDPVMRGRVMALFLAIALGGTPIGAPFVGWVADRFGPRWALAVGAASGFAAAIVAIRYLAKYHGMRMVRRGAGIRFQFGGDAAISALCDGDGLESFGARTIAKMPQQPYFKGLEPPPVARATDALFFAVLPDAQAVERIASTFQYLSREHDLKGRSVKRENFHVTLYPLGEYAGLPQDAVDQAMAAAQTIKAAPFEAVFDQAMSFRSSQGPRLVLCGTDGVKDLARLQAEFAAKVKAIAPGGAQKTPHITLLYGDKAIEKQAVAPVDWVIREFVLVHSLLGKGRHEILGRWTLSG